MTQGLEEHQDESPRSLPADRHSTLVRQGSPADACQNHLIWGRPSSLRSVDSTLDLERDAYCEERDGQEGKLPGEHVTPCNGEGPEQALEERQRQATPEAPDGGWGWIVVASTILVLALTLAFPSCIGIFYTDLQTEFNASNTETSWVPAIMTAVLHGGGPLCSVLVELYGCRPVVMLGGILSGSGMAASFFAQSITALYLTAGVITGLGFCFSFQPAITMIGHYFVRRRAFANAMSSTGTALGLSILPLLAYFLRGRYGWRGSFLIFGGILLNCCVCGAVLRPLHPKRRSSRGLDRQRPSDTDDGHPRQTKPPGGLKGRLWATLSVLVSFLHRHMGFDLLRSNPRYRAFSLSVSWMMLGFTVPLLYLVPYATSQGMEQQRAALLMSILGLVNIFMRPAVALVFGLPRFRRSPYFVYMFATAILVNGLSNSVCGIAATFPVLLVFVVMFGLSMSFIGSLLVTVLMDTVDIRRFHSALGLICCMESVSVLMGPPLAGLLLDRTGQYRWIFFACSVNVATAGLFLMGSFLYLDRQRRREAQSHPPPPCEQPLRPVLALSAPDTRYSPVPSHSQQAQDPGQDPGQDSANVSDV
ncbi:hypothetical protein ACEWY4_003401 [Coilia grayii]|uniref:Major facilitator superfamily (MFS) profile domain-containing protein n=1 Tax=Coilia grayii TaxID=363190 RepID=A0ABD1KR51_9TELE